MTKALTQRGDGRSLPVPDIKEKRIHRRKEWRGGLL